MFKNYVILCFLKNLIIKISLKNEFNYLNQQLITNVIYIKMIN